MALLIRKIILDTWQKSTQRNFHVVKAMAIMLRFLEQPEIKQACIPVECVPPAHWPYLVVSAKHAPCHTCPPATHAPPATHTPLPCMLPCHACPLPHMPPLPTMHASPLCMPLPRMSQLPLPCMPPPHTPPAMHAPPRLHMPPPCGQNSWHTLLKILPCPNFVAGGNKHCVTIFSKPKRWQHNKNLKINDLIQWFAFWFQFGIYLRKRYSWINHLNA